MYTFSYLVKSLVFILLACLSLPASANMPMEYTDADDFPEADDHYFDYLPKYRRFKDHYQIDKIEYRPKRTIIHFRFVVQKEGNTTFYGGMHPYAWYLRTPPRMRGLEIQFKMLEIRDIRINNKLQLETFVHLPQVDYNTQRGDVISCELHFIRIPKYINMLDLIEGKDADTDPKKHNCFDILIKKKNHPVLGTEKESVVNLSRFEENIDYISPQAAEEPTAEEIVQSKEFAALAEAESVEALPAGLDDIEERTEPTTKAERALEPIDYMPKGLHDLVDLECNTRVYLPDVHFRDNEDDFDGRVAAINNLRLVVKYLNLYPEARIRLHGHTDIFGDRYNNLVLSRKRALLVKHTLQDMGVRGDRIDILFYGGEQPLIEYSKGGDQNRRVEVEPLCGEEAEENRG